MRSNPTLNIVVKSIQSIIYIGCCQRRIVETYWSIIKHSVLVTCLVYRMIDCPVAIEMSWTTVDCQDLLMLLIFSVPGLGYLKRVSIKIKHITIWYLNAWICVRPIHVCIHKSNGLCNLWHNILIGNRRIIMQYVTQGVTVTNKYWVSIHRRIVNNAWPRVADGHIEKCVWPGVANEHIEINAWHGVTNGHKENNLWSGVANGHIGNYAWPWVANGQIENNVWPGVAIYIYIYMLKR